MKPAVLLIILVQFLGGSALAATLRGKVKDNYQEPLIGAHIVVEGQNRYAVAGLDGSFQIHNVAPGSYRIVISFIGYQTHTRQILVNSNTEVMQLDIELLQDVSQLAEVTITATAAGGSEAEARTVERTSPNTLNVVSAKAIALSPDVSVANVVQRVSGLSIERNSNGDPQYAIVRGMDKRYSYTLVNGIKIPSPDNKNRYLPLDIFPASLLERLEVYKSLTADREGDAIGGGINMVMKSAPEEREIKGDVQLGYNYINIKDGFNKYNTGAVRDKSPRELYGLTYQAQPADFSQKNLETKNITPMPDVLGTVSFGNRFLNRKLGVMVGASVQNTWRGTESLWFDSETDRFGSNLPALSLVQDRQIATHQLRIATHGRLDYRLAANQEISAYVGYFKLDNAEAREIRETYLDGRNYNSQDGDAILGYYTRTRTTRQQILNTTLQGKHAVGGALKIDWSAVYSDAGQQRPDNALFIRSGELLNGVEQPVNVDRRNPRQWDHNDDQDYAAYLNVTFQPQHWATSAIKAGALYRQKERDNYFNRYLFDPSPGVQIQGKDWSTYSDVTWSIVNPAGSATDEQNYKASEDITAYYALGKAEVLHTQINAGVRVEETKQGYTLKTPKDGQTPDSTQHYTDVLPSVNLLYKGFENMNIRLAYYRAIARPGFFEIVPYTFEDDGLDEGGNPGLKRTKADNIDLRWEYFPSVTDQLFIGAFYKHIQDPIEYAVVRDGVNNEAILKPGNYGNAYNLGLEVDLCKFFNKFGIKANYTYTRSRITTSKGFQTRVDPNDQTSELIVKTVNQTRSLQGQATHIGNISFLYKDVANGLEAQLAVVYTGERLEVISPYLDNDMYAKPIVQADFAIQKRIGDHIEVFARVINLINSPYEVYIKKRLLQGENPDNVYPHQDAPDKRTLVRRDQYYQSARLGVRFNF